jgi:hypothetical protein
MCTPALPISPNRGPEPPRRRSNHAIFAAGLGGAGKLSLVPYSLPGAKLCSLGVGRLLGAAFLRPVMDQLAESYRILRGTDGSNPSPSSGESAANRLSGAGGSPIKRGHGIAHGVVPPSPFLGVVGEVAEQKAKLGTSELARAGMLSGYTDPASRREPQTCLLAPRARLVMLQRGTDTRLETVVCKHQRARAADPGIQLRNSAVPSPYSPLTIGPIKMPGTRKTSAIARPFSGRTMNQATASERSRRR